MDSAGWVGEDTSLALDADGRAHISYYNLTDSSLKYAVRTEIVYRYTYLPLVRRSP